MIQVIIFLAGFYLMFNIVKNNSYQRVVWFFIGLLLIPPGVTFFDKPFSWFVIFSLLLSLIVNNNFIRKVNNIPLKGVFVVSFICLICIGLFDNRISVSQKLIRPLLYYFENILPGILVYASLVSLKNYRKLYLSLVYIMAVFAIYGVFCYVAQYNGYIAILSSEFNFRDISRDFLNGSDGRVRTSSFLFHPYLFGILLLFCSLITFYLFQFGNKKRDNKRLLFIIIVLFIINILLINSRTVLIVFILLTGLYFFLQVNYRNLYLLFFGSVLTYLVILFTPSLKEKTDLILDIFESGGQKVQGSSVEMREVQLLASYTYFLQKPITGNGFNYLYEGIGFRTEISERESSSDLYAFESYFYVLLIEQGVLGILSNIILFTSLIYYFLKNIFVLKLLKHKRFVLSNLLLVIGYLIFILATGTINSFPFFMLFVGISLSVQQKLVSNDFSIENKSKLI
jgi:hypothetical protein